MNKEEDCLKRAEKILNEMSSWNGLELEVLKIFCLFSRCNTMIHDSQEWVNINYVREKIFNLLVNYPTLLSRDAQNMYLKMRIEKEYYISEKKESQHDHI